ncbi:MAG: aldo/keto reductase [Spirochaetaceae bacterium]|nr:MAG: aldo/keto reductase [Spirochaetaceae bacterium]
MNYRTLGKTGFSVSEISLGTWQLGGGWGQPFNDGDADRLLNEAIDAGINFLDTADVYSDGASERAVGRVVRSRSERVYVATKCGRRVDPHVSAGYSPQAMRGFVEDSLNNSGLERLDLIQLHCPPTEVYYRPEIFAEFDRLKGEGKIASLGVSVERVEEAMKAIEFPIVDTVQIIFNMFRHRPADRFFSLARAANVGIIVRVPLASGLLSGKMRASQTFAADDHRHFNRDGAAFDKGETFSGVDFERGLAAVDELKQLFGEDEALALWALRWILMFDEVSCVIPGTTRSEQMRENIRAAALPALTPKQMQAVREVYDRHIRADVHPRW